MFSRPPVKLNRTLTTRSEGPMKPVSLAIKPPQAKKVKFPWLGNKTSTPRPRGAGKAHRAAQVNTSSYKPMTLRQAMGGK